MAERALPSDAAFEASDRQLRRSVNFVPLLFLSIGTVIGSGWLFGVLAADAVAGPAAVISWVVGGVFMMLIALVYAEVAGMLPRSGALVRYPYLTYGGFIGVLIGWAYLLAGSATAPIESEAVITYIGGKFPGLDLTRTAQGVKVLTGSGIGLALVLILVFFVVNYFGVRFLAEVNRWVVWWKLIIPTLTFLFLFFLFRASNFTALPGGFAPFGAAPVLQALPLAGVIFAYTGFRQALEYGGEARNPQRDLPLAVIGSLVITTGIYVLLQVAFTGALSFSKAGLNPGAWGALESSKWASGPFYSALATSGVGALGAFAMVLLIDAAVSPAGTGWIAMGSTARNFYGLGVHDSLPRLFRRLNRFRIPWIGLLAALVVGCLFLVPVPSWYTLVGYATDATVLTYILGGLSVPILRRTAGELHRPFRLPAARVLAPLSFLAALLILYWSGFQTLANVFAVVFLGLAIYTGYYAPRKGRINPAVGGAITILFLAAWISINKIGGWVLSTGTHAAAGSVSFPVYYILFAGAVIVFTAITWAASNPVGRTHIRQSIWLIALVLATLLLAYFSEYGPLTHPPLTFPVSDLIEVAIGLAAYYWGVTSGFATEDLQAILQAEEATQLPPAEPLANAADD